MVLSRNDKRKRKEGDLVDLMDPLAEPPKRTKIHAQRKFAQGVATPAYSPANTPSKEKDKTKSTAFTELITHKRPNTEDFLTFLCFRGTSVLPPSLNFFNSSSKKDKYQNAIKSSVSSNLFSKKNDTSGKLISSSKFEHQPSISTTPKSTSNKEKPTDCLKKQLSAPIPKVIKLKTASTAIQALKKKYQEQRLAKQRLKKKFKPTCMKTRSCALVADQLPVKSRAMKVESPKKIISQIENRRHGLRSTGLTDNEKESLPVKNLKKQLPLKLKKSHTVSKGDSANVDSFMIKTNAKGKVVAKMVTGKLIRKKFLNRRREIEARRVTRSHVDVPVIVAESASSTLSRRPTRKTKEAAAVYMEILGRKLVSPELENEDNMSLDSFPELPNARKIAQTENEIKAKVKSLKFQATVNASTTLKDKEKNQNNTSASKSIKRNITKPIVPLKSRRMVKVQKYYELNSDEETLSLKEIIEKTKASSITRRSAPASIVKQKKRENCNLRSTRSLAPRKSFSKVAEKQKNSTYETDKLMKNSDSLNITKSNKETNNIKDKELSKEKTIFNAKRKRESNINDKEKESNSKQKLESIKAKNKISDAIADESEEESLGAILNKMRKKKESQKEESIIDIVAKKIAEPKMTKVAATSWASTCSTTLAVTSTKSTTGDLLKNQATNEGTTTKISDDEESFRGFTKNAISKVVNNCHSHAKASSGLLQNIDSKANILKPHEIMIKEVTGKDIKKVDIKAIPITAMFPGIKSIQEHQMESGTTNATTNASVKQEPDFGEPKLNTHLKVPITSSSSLNIIDMPKTLSYGRKERVNMSTEQIEKWLNESSLAKEESKVEMESVSNFKFDSLTTDKAKNGTTAVPPLSHGHLSISPKIQHLVRPVNVTLSKLSDRLKKASSFMSTNKPTVFLSNFTGQVTPVKPQQPPVAVTKLKPRPAASGGGAIAAKEKKEPNISPNRKMSKDSSFSEDPADSDVVSKSDVNSVGDSSEKKSLSSPEKKVFFHQRKPFLSKVKERKMTSNSSAFSPENESSVYAFESEAETPVSTPFRRKAREVNVKESSVEKNKSGSTQSTNPPSTSSEKKGKSGEEITKVTEPLNSPEEARKNEEKSSPLVERTTPKNFELPKNFADLTNVQVLPLDKLTTSWSNVNYSASIAVQVNFDDQKHQQQQQQQSKSAESNRSNLINKSTEISTQTDANTDNDDDNDSGQLFYIPLQAVTRNASAQGGQQLIQGVAVKLGTEGPTGPNQRVLLKAKLVTKPPISVARCPPIGTVQPTTRMPQNISSEQIDIPSTSSLEAGSAGFKIQEPEEKEIKTVSIGNKQINKTSSPEKVIRSLKSNIKERKSLSDGSKGFKKAQGKTKHIEIFTPVNKTSFPKMKDCNEEACLVEAPTFRPSEKDFQDPLEYIDKIRPIAEKFGICKVIPPSNFKPECKVSDDMRFTAYNHYVHRMLHRWGPNVKEMMAIKKYLATQSITLTQPPWIGGMEVDLPHLYQTVQNLGGLKEVIEKKKWQKVADGMKIPRSAQDRVTKLDDIYCKYLLPYDTLSQDERDKLFNDVEADWMKREKRDRQETRSNDTEDEDEEDSTEEIEECIVKGRNMPLNAFYRIARNTLRMWFGENQRTTSETDGASVDEVETSFWKHVVEKKRHVCVHAASIDSSGRGFGFSVAKNSPFGRHPWNLKILTNNASSVLRALGPQMGVTVPTLHVGMLFSACCWYRDPHGLPWIEYLHTGAKKIWYGIPNEQNNTFRKALTKMFPRYCKNKTIWLPSDTAMVPPDMLVRNGVPLCQTVQEPGQFIIVFPKAFTSSICTGYVVSESVYFAQLSWLKTAEKVFQDIHESCEPSIFSFERLLFSIINDSRSHIDVLKQILPTVKNICDKEIEDRKKLKNLGLANTEKLPLPENEKKGKNKKVKEEVDYECDTCRANLFVSLVSNPMDESIFCLTHAMQYIEKRKQVLKNCTLLYTYSESELYDLVHKLKERIEAKSKKTNQTKHAK